MAYANRFPHSVDVGLGVAMATSVINLFQAAILGPILFKALPVQVT
jgi:hypothetical protein